MKNNKNRPYVPANKTTDRIAVTEKLIEIMSSEQLPVSAVGKALKMSLNIGKYLTMENLPSGDRYQAIKCFVAKTPEQRKAMVIPYIKRKPSTVQPREVVNKPLIKRIEALEKSVAHLNVTLTAMSQLLVARRRAAKNRPTTKKRK